MTLQFAFIKDCYPTWGQTEQQVTRQKISSYIDNISTIKPYQKLRIINSCLEIDNRRFKPLMRFLSGDNRYKILDKLRTSELTIADSKKVLKILQTLMDTTYKRDKKWCHEANKLITTILYYY